MLSWVIVSLVRFCLFQRFLVRSFEISMVLVYSCEIMFVSLCSNGFSVVPWCFLVCIVEYGRSL